MLTLSSVISRMNSTLADLEALRNKNDAKVTKHQKRIDAHQSERDRLLDENAIAGRAAMKLSSLLEDLQ